MGEWTRRGVLGGVLASSVASTLAHAQSLATSPPLWIAHGAVGSAVLFGQMPVRSQTPWQTETVMAAFDSSQALWLENPVFTREEGEALATSLHGKLRITTADFLPSEDMRRLHAQLSRAGKPKAEFDGLPADDLYQQLSSLADANSGADFSRLPERIFRAGAAQAGKPIHTEWKSLAEVSSFMPSAPDPLRLQLMRLALDDFDVAWQMDERLQAWISGDVLYFDRSGAIIAHRYPNLTAKMNGQRNRRLAERLISALEKPGQHFVCVGIRHVSGPESIQSFLTAGGVPVTRL